MTKLRGDFKDHAILLCNFFLELGVQAYVCIGSAKRSPATEKIDQPHVWVMTKYYSIPERLESVGRVEYVTFWEISDGKAYELDEIHTIINKKSNEDEGDPEKELMKAKRFGAQAVQTSKKPVFKHNEEELLNDDAEDVVLELMDHEELIHDSFSSSSVPLLNKGKDDSNDILDKGAVQDTKFDFFQSHLYFLFLLYNLCLERMKMQ